ncbi:hypothetical protein HFO07_27835 [Rhizobium leguminosarum]|uniref:hypothetical protein n=1 Tax=Rhizobium leguminosarum TaxID=384 RepID=UPI001C93EF17|nr:hypothetical protein [Rhizobium leguminosarum]MBY5760420.1 hypothetical protein [Rhizobium leguminosarum]
MKNLSARNPLSIIALFISLIYGISALLLGASVDKLTPDNQVRLVWFIIGFPVGILLAFLYLVTWHHRKLYSPSDFRTDESFLTSGDPEAIGKKYLAEGQPAVDNSQRSAADEEAPPEEEAADGLPTTTDEVNGEEARSSVKPLAPPAVPRKSESNPTAFAAYAYMIEGLVMQELQNEYQSPIRRDASFPMANGRLARVDGIIERPSGPLITEIKFIRPRGEFMRRLREGSMQLRSYITIAREIIDPKTSGILVLVLDGLFGPQEIGHIMEAARNIGENDILVRVLKSQDLMNKYGLSSPLA